MRLTDKQRRLLRSVEAQSTGGEHPVAGSLAFSAGFSEYAILGAVKRLEGRGLIERVPGTFTGDSPYGAWSTRWRLTGAGREALS